MRMATIVRVPMSVQRHSRPPEEFRPDPEIRMSHDRPQSRLVACRQQRLEKYLPVIECWRLAALERRRKID